MVKTAASLLLAATACLLLSAPTYADEVGACDSSAEDACNKKCDDAVADLTCTDGNTYICRCNDGTSIACAGGTCSIDDGTSTSGSSDDDSTDTSTEDDGYPVVVSDDGSTCECDEGKTVVVVDGKCSCN